MATKRYVHVGLALDPRVDIKIPCDEFNVGENDDIQVFLGSELWGYFPASIYVYLEEVEEEDVTEDPTAQEDDSEAEEDDTEGTDEVEQTAILAPTDINLGAISASPNGSSTYTDPEEVVSSALN